MVEQHPEEEQEDTLNKLNNPPTPINLKLELQPSYLLLVWQEMTLNNLNNRFTLNKANNNLDTLDKDNQHMEHLLEELIRWQISFKE